MGNLVSSVAPRALSIGSDMFIGKDTGKTVPIEKKPMSTGTVAEQVKGQVLTSSAEFTIDSMTPAELSNYLSVSGLNESETQAMMGMFLASVIKQEKETSADSAKESVQALMNFDPVSWEKHVGVLVAAIVAVNIARQASAEMSGKFAQMAYEAAEGQGEAIISGGQAAMWAAVTGSVVSATMAVGGAALSIQAQGMKHSDLKFNKGGAAKLDSEAAGLRLELKSTPVAQSSSAPRKVTGTTSEGRNETVELRTDKKELTPQDRAVLETSIRKIDSEAKDLRMKSALQQKTIENKLTIGGALSSLAMITSSGLSSILRLQEYNERQKEVLRAAEQNINKSVGDVETQSLAEDTALISKMLDAIQQLVDGRNATVNNVATARA